MTAEAGYLTRRLVDVAHDVIIRTEDCHTTEGLIISLSDPYGQEHLLGRVTAKNVLTPSGAPVVMAGVQMTEPEIALVVAEGAKR